MVLSWNGIGHTLACLESLKATARPALHIIVVDNGSTDGTRETLRQLTCIDLIENDRNLGFAAGNNVGIRHALESGIDAVLVLNNDTLVEPQAIARLLAAMNSDPRVGACSPVLPYTADPGRLWFAGASYDPTRGRSGRSSPYERGTPLPEDPVAIDRVAGAAMLMRRQALEEVGLFSDELFFLHEDVDWSLRARAAGWRLLLVPSASIDHSVSASQGGDPVTPVTAYYGTRNDLELGRRHGTYGGLRTLRRQMICFAVHVAQVRRAARGVRATTLLATAVGALDFRRRRLGERGHSCTQGSHCNPVHKLKMAVASFRRREPPS